MSLSKSSHPSYENGNHRGSLNFRRLAEDPDTVETPDAEETVDGVENWKELEEQKSAYAGPCHGASGVTNAATTAKVICGKKTELPTSFLKFGSEIAVSSMELGNPCMRPNCRAASTWSCK